MEDPYSAENIDRLGVLMFQTSDNSQLLRRVLWINAELTIVWTLKHKNTQPNYIFNRENPQNSEPQNGPRRELDFIALGRTNMNFKTYSMNLSFLSFQCFFSVLVSGVVELAMRVVWIGFSLGWSRNLFLHFFLFYWVWKETFQPRNGNKVD